MRILDRFKDRRIWKWTAATIAIILLLAALWWYWPVEEKSTPHLLQSRGLDWEVVIEDPIAFEEVQPIVAVFLEQIRVLFEINSYRVLYRTIHDDGIEAYEHNYRDHSEYPAPQDGLITIPLYFVTGYGRDGHADGWAHRNPQYFKATNELRFKIVTATESEEPKYLHGGMYSLIVLLHEFGHVMGLKDLYLGGDIGGCSGLPVIMTNNIMSLDSENIPFELDILVGELLLNRTKNMIPVGNGTDPELLIVVEEAYLQENNLYMNSYSIIKDQEENLKVSYHPTVPVYSLDQLRTMWTIEEAAFIGMDGEFVFTCPQEFS